MFRIVNIALLIALFVTPLSAQGVKLKVTGAIDLGTLGGTVSRATGINESGQVVGISKTANGEEHAFLWEARRGMVDLGVLAGAAVPAANAHGISKYGQIVGESLCGTNCTDAVIWDTAGGIMDIGSLGSGGNQALAINDLGQFGGIATTAPLCRTCYNYAFIASIPSGNFQFLGALGTGMQSWVRGLNNTGLAVGGSELDATQVADHAFLWSARSGMIDLGTIGGTSSDAYAVNNLGQVVGWSDIGRAGSTGFNRAFLWQPGAGMTDLGSLDGGLSQAHAINDNGVIAGWSTFNGVAHHAVIWQSGGGLFDVGSYSNGGASEAHAINSALQVAGEMTLINGETHAFLWTLETVQGSQPPVAICGSGRSGGLVIGPEGTLVGFNASASYDPDGGTLDFQWSFGDGSFDHTGSVGFTSHSYADNGNYAVQVSVTDPDGLSSQAQCTAQIFNVEPTLLCSVRGCTGGIPGGSILQGETFTAFGSFVDPGADTWIAGADYGDGTLREQLTLYGKQFTLSHRYKIAGTFTVSVQVSDDDGGIGTAANQVFVKSWQQALQELGALVTNLNTIGSLNNGDANALIQKLMAAISQIDSANPAAAANQITAFVNQVTALIGSGQLQPAAGQTLIDAANRILAAMLP